MPAWAHRRVYEKNVKVVVFCYIKLLQKKKQEKIKVKQRIVPTCSGDVRVGDIELCVLGLTLHPHRLSTFLSIVFLVCIYIFTSTNIKNVIHNK